MIHRKRTISLEEANEFASKYDAKSLNKSGTIVSIFVEFHNGKKGEKHCFISKLDMEDSDCRDFISKHCIIGSFAENTTNETLFHTMPNKNKNIYYCSYEYFDYFLKKYPQELSMYGKLVRIFYWYYDADFNIVYDSYNYFRQYVCKEDEYIRFMILYSES